MRKKDRSKHEPHTPLSTDHDHLHSRTLEEFPDGPYGSPLLLESLGKSSDWDTGEHVAPRFSYENKDLHDDLPRLEPQADPIRYEHAEDETLSNKTEQ